MLTIKHLNPCLDYCAVQLKLDKVPRVQRRLLFGALLKCWWLSAAGTPVFYNTKYQPFLTFWQPFLL